MQKKKEKLNRPRDLTKLISPLFVLSLLDFHKTPGVDLLTFSCCSREGVVATGAPCKRWDSIHTRVLKVWSPKQSITITGKIAILTSSQTPLQRS